MSRIVFKQGQQRHFLDKIKYRSCLSLSQLAIQCGRNVRTFRDWYNENSFLPYDIGIKLSKLYSTPLPKSVSIKPEFWYVKKAGSLGGSARMEKYGNPGTPDGRRLGGLRSQITHTKLGTGFIKRKKVKLPRRNGKVAEMVGILLGDGAISRYQIHIHLNNKVDALYGEWISQLFSDLFKVKVSKAIRDENTLELTITSINLVEYFLKLGLKRGDKIRNKVTIPDWIKENKFFARACLRGLVDTDGCVYIDKHKKGDKIYRNICIDFTSYSPILLDAAFDLFGLFDLNPRKYTRSIKLRRESGVIEYFRVIGSSNQKHIDKFEKFFNSK